MARVDDRIKISEIFYSLQGEGLSAGAATVFVRLVGCPLRCSYCDTAYAFSGGEWMSVRDILSRVAEHRARYVTVTGGEPLAQKRCLDLLRGLCDAGYIVSLETGGAHDIADIDARVIRVMDIKTPASGEESKNRAENIDCLRAADQVKFVICDRSDYEWAKRKVDEHCLADKCEVLFSPSWQQQDATQLAQWILDDQLAVRFQMQLHKVLWGDVRGR